MWLLQDDVARAMAQALKAGFCPTAEQVTGFFAVRPEAADGGDLRVMKVAGDTAEILVEGVLTPKPDLLAFLFGGGNTTYQEITAALARAQTDPAVKRAVLRINSPGGQMDGLFETLAALEAFTKPTSTLASRACSAAYAIAAATGKIEAVNAAAEFGSSGVATKLTVDEDVVELTSTLAPKKRPDPRTPEGQAIIREYLDSIHELFADAIARGRGVGRKVVDTTFGSGATVLATDAKRLGMIDKIAQPALRPIGANKAVRGESELGAKAMNIETLKAEHPETYAAVIAEGKASATPVAPSPPATPSLQLVPNNPPPNASGAGQERPMDLKTLRAQHPEAYEAAVAEGVTQERKRTKAHLHMGAQCGDLSLAVDAINNGADFSDPEAQSKYLAAGMNRADRAVRQQETTTAAAAVEGAVVNTEARDMGDQVADLVEQMLGKKAG